MPQIVNKVTGKIFNASDTDWNAGDVYDQKDSSGANIWSLAPAGSAVSTNPTPAPVTPNNQISSSVLSNSAPNLAAQANKKGTFITITDGKVTGRSALDIGTQGDNQFLETAINGADYARDPSQYYVTYKSSDGKTLYGVKKPQPIVQTPNSAQNGTVANANGQSGNNGQTASETPKSVTEQLDEMMNNSTFDRAAANNQHDVPEKSEIVNTLKGELDQFQNEIDYNQVLQTAGVAKIKEEYYAQKEALEGRVMPMSYFNGQLAKLTDKTNISLDKESIAAALTNATNTYRYNSKLIEYNVALGDLQNAQNMVQQMAQDFKDFNTQKLQILQFQNTIDQQTAALYQKEVDREYEMATNGYTYIQSPSALQELAKQKGVQWVKDNTINISGKIYIKPSTDTAVITAMQSKYVDAGILSTDSLAVATNKLKSSKIYQNETGSKSNWGVIGTDDNGNPIYGFVNETNQTVTPYTGTEMRTDRHNNPIAFAVTKGGSNQFTKALDDAGIAWSYGDAFPNNPGMVTVKVDGDGIEAARAVLSNTNAIQGWYINSTGKNVLPQYGVKTNKDFKKLSIEQQNAIINGIYRAEGGSGKLFQTTETGEDYNARLQNILPTLTVAGQKNAQKYVKELIAKGDTKAVDNYLNNLARQSLTGTMKEDYNIYGTTKAEASIALDLIGQLKETNVDAYKNVLEKAKPWAKIQKDQDWVKITSQVQMTQAQLRRAMFGTAVTETEMASAAAFLIGETDDIKTIETKLKGMSDFADRARNRVIMEAQGVSSEQLEVTAPDGKKYQFKSVQDARAFQAEINEIEKLQGNQYDNVSVIKPNFNSNIEIMK